MIQRCGAHLPRRTGHCNRPMSSSRLQLCSRSWIRPQTVQTRRNLSLSSACFAQARPHPLSKPGPHASNSQKSSAQEQQFTAKSLIACATFVGATSYLIAKIQSGSKESTAADAQSGKINIPNPSQQDYDAAVKKIKSLLPEDCITVDPTDLQSCIAPWSCQWLSILE